ncbi:InlB B-repeat-containing protein [Flammeovirga sp. MY04]|uniref:InlB B-repeat-containing protein n=1 Tax=Flammeovirga sp. MY04 TaxID=1191459 RepID=UPI000825732B|nr:InlB B-repeat-containing protein [Flammeovirga sp. MY04]ANQ52781.2 InlB B-repeat-containing protein [Flammeovirga sp. MY04]
MAKQRILQFLVSLLILSGCQVNDEAPAIHSVSFETNGGTQIPTQEVTHGEVVTKPVDPERAGHEFLNWTKNDDPYNFEEEVLNDFTLVAEWEAIAVTYNVTFQFDNGAADSVVTVIENDFITEPNDPTKDDYVFVAWMSGEEVFDFATPITKETILIANYKEAYKPNVNPDATPFITEVLDFSPAPGQFVNYVDKEPSMENIIGNSHQFISLGTFGGSVTFKFDHSIMNNDGNDLAIYGNSFTGPYGDSCEPGIVMVCQDLNGNGIADEDEPWYQLKGSEYDKPETKHNFKITYYKPEEGENEYEIKYVSEYAGKTEEGVLDFKPVEPFHQHAMFPNSSYYTEGQITFEGTCLASNLTEEDGIYSNNAYDWGYADNKGYEQEGVLQAADVFDLDNAVDMEGNKVNLVAVDFVKVYTATTDMAGWLGERSTEIVKAADISLLEIE